MEWRERGKKQYIQHDTKNKKTVKVHEMESGAYAGQDGGGIPPLHCYW